VEFEILKGSSSFVRCELFGFGFGFVQGVLGWDLVSVVYLD